MVKLQEIEQAAGGEATQNADENQFNACLAEFLAMTRSLETIIEVENDLLRNGKRASLGAQQDRKEALTAELRVLFPKLLEMPQMLKGPDNAKYDLLVDRIKGVQRLLADNRMLLNAAKVATFKRIEAAVEVRRQQIESGRRYGNAGDVEQDTVRVDPILMPSRKV
ncbi:MAG TPA: hypothetical protein EYH07_09415 [Kiloniellaceae bacterium]|nr:hypothetical protein [Kiloniellaceae bacterium]HIP78663.1 hypothetical protein [Kiloniellaceae bacterium]